ncbi:hypothetical protein [Microbulbifer sediminum]|uniref:hypothetical protein n=1 Tax=Microbulbifer sediminum TaxID=2904250 RepID=UPI001F2B1A0B|nr:hypothetical protein [Microbulbifer sediminum]
MLVVSSRVVVVQFSAIVLFAYSPFASAQAGSEFLAWTFFKALFAVLVLLGLTFAGLKAYVHWRGLGNAAGGSASDISLGERKRISNTLTLYSVSWKGREYLVAEAGSNLTVIDKTEKDVEA